MAVDLNAVKELRYRSGRVSLTAARPWKECGNDLEKAVDYLREKGLAKAAKKAGRPASGRAYFQLHSTNGKSVLWSR